MDANRPRETASLGATTPEVSGASTYAGDLDAWTAAVRDCEARCAEHGFGAAIASIGLRAPGAADELRRRALAALAGVLRATDIVGVVGADELGVVLVPVDDIEQAQRIVRALDRALAGAGVDAAVGWAMRLEGHGLFHAAARADAALVSARHRSADRAIDLTGGAHGPMPG